MADWSASKDHKAFALAVLLLAVILLPAVCSAQELGHWWSDPCDKLRKVRHEGNQEVFTQLNNVISSLKHQMPKLKRIFKTTMPTPHVKLNLSWLNIPKFRKAMKRQKTKDYALAEFHKVLQIYGGTLYILNETEIESKAYDAEKASLLLSNVAYELKRLTCEVANELDEKNVKSKILSLEDMNIKMNKKVDFSTAHLEYATILKSYTRFLRNSRNILFGKGKKKKPKNSRNRKQ